MSARSAVTAENWDAPPHNRWSFQHVHELFPACRIASGPDIPVALPTQRRDILHLSFAASGGAGTSIREFLDRACCDALLVAQHHRIIAEHYFHGMTVGSHHLLFSVSKAFVGMLTGIAVDRGQLEPSALITRYLPELDNVAWHGTTVRHLLDMTAAARYAEDYADPETDFWKESAVVGWRPALVGKNTPQTLLDYAASLDCQDMTNGSVFRYRTVCANVLGMVVERAMGARLTHLLETDLWSRLATSYDASVVVDRSGFPYVGAGMSACARDLANFGVMMINDGELKGQQVVPAAWIADTVQGDSTSKECFAKGPYGAECPGWHFRNQIWVASSETAVMLAIGIYGQYLYMDKAREIVIVMLSSQPEPFDAALDVNTLLAMHVIASSLHASSN